MSESFDLEVYNNYLSEGKSKKEIQFWLNLIEITSVFDGISIDDSVKLAISVTQMWNLKLNSEIPMDESKARVIHDKEEDEVFITID